MNAMTPEQDLLRATPSAARMRRMMTQRQDELARRIELAQTRADGIERDLADIADRLSWLEAELARRKAAINGR